MQTDYLPYQRQIYNHSASFWRRTKPPVLGTIVAQIPETMRATLQRNTGVFVDVVMENSPAFRANILSGDVIIQIADKPVSTTQEFLALLPALAGQKVSVKLIRGTQTLDVDVQLNKNF